MCKVQTIELATFKLTMIKGFLNLPWFVWAVLALVVDILYSFVWPQKMGDAAIDFRFLFSAGGTC